MARKIIGDGPVQSTKRYESSRANQIKQVKTKLVQCLECGQVITVISKPSLISRILQLDCRNCKRLKAEKKAVESRELTKRKVEEIKARKEFKDSEKRRRHCPDCGVVWYAPYGSRGKNTDTTNRCSVCKDLHRAHRVRCKAYNISSHTLEALIQSSELRCMNPGCCRPLTRSLKEAGGNKWDVLCIDHDHNTGEVRGILCHECNFALGHLKDSFDRVLGLATYLVD